jgi:hypothetical protein
VPVASFRRLTRGLIHLDEQRHFRTSENSRRSTQAVSSVPIMPYAPLKRAAIPRYLLDKSKQGSRWGRRTRLRQRWCQGWG